MKRYIILGGLLLSFGLSASAQYAWQDDAEAGKLQPFADVHYTSAMQGSFSSGNTPLWLNANKYGMSSLKSSNGYLRETIYRPLKADSCRRWGMGYGVDVAVTSRYASKFFLQQAYVEGRWLHGVLTIGAKEWPMELKNQRLSSGSQALGINARPIPEVRIALPEYWTIPALGRWFALKGHIAYGMYTDDNWQRDFTLHGQTPYNEHTLYHSKAGYLRIGKPFWFPLSVEFGLEMQAQFGGYYLHQENGTLVKRRLGDHNLKDFWRAFVPGGSDASDGTGYGNVEGNQSGAWMTRVNYDTDDWSFSAYIDHFFEDHSQMYFLGYDGYGQGADFQKHEKRRDLLYPLKDMMLGGELQLKHGSWLKDIVVEYLYTKYQSGPINHDRTSHLSDAINGQDDYYNHGNYMSLQHWGQVIGNPLYRSPLYNDDATIRVEDNRFVAWHMGVEGQPLPRLDYRILASWQRGYGTYYDPYTHARHNTSILVEAGYRFNHGWAVRGAFGLDHGSILGNNHGVQLTIIRRGMLSNK